MTYITHRKRFYVPEEIYQSALAGQAIRSGKHPGMGKKIERPGIRKNKDNKEDNIFNSLFDQQ
ncbi:MAG: hypothetical protein EBU90_07790 [Proteobacteria bacterium]|nr:hypothetical protein [Pseudomonadota bacterium]NBP14100.1 hypothetical protein [bacterium]